MAKKKGKSSSVAQQRLMGMAYAYAKGEMKGASPQVKFVAKSFLDKGKKKGLKNLKSFASTKHEGLPQKIKESIKIMRFDELKSNSDSTDVIDELYELSNGDITGLVNDLVKCGNHKDRQEIVEEILFDLDDMSLPQEKYNQFQVKLDNYLNQQLQKT